MKKLLLALLCLTIFSVSAQTNKDYANVYLKRANVAIEESIDYDTALTYFKKAMSYTDSITEKKVALLGSLIYFEVHHTKDTEVEQLEFLEKSKEYSAQYFNLAKNSNSEEYMACVESSILINETLEDLKIKIKKIEEEKIAKEKEIRKIDSLKTIWNTKSDLLSLKVDSIYLYNKDNKAIFTKNGKFGVINDRGEIKVKADEYIDVLNFDGFILLKNKVDEPTKIYCYNSKSDSGFLIPSFSDFNTLSTHYGKVMLPRGNGRLIMYPNNSYKPFVYDLNLKKTINIGNQENLFKNLKKNDIIDKYNKDGEVKINKKWFVFGGHLGGGIHPLYIPGNYNLFSYLCSIDGNVLSTSSNYQHIGAFYNNKLQAIKDGKTLWINQNGTKVSAPKDESGIYQGNSKVVKIENGIYQIKKDGIIILGNEKLEKMGDFLRKNATE